MKPVLSCIFALMLVACGATAPQPAQPPAATAPLRPCGLPSGILYLPVPEPYVLVAGEGACLLIDERYEETFVSIALVEADAVVEEDEPVTAARLRDAPRDALRQSGLLGASPRFTGRETLALAHASAEAQRFVATPEGLSERIGSAIVWPIGTDVILLFVFAGDADHASALESLITQSRFEATTEVSD